MKIIMVAVVSADGKLTHGNDPDIYKWTSKEDQDFFFGLIDKAKVIVMGSGTYEAVRHRLKHNSSRLRIVLTSNPNKYADEQIKETLEFSSESPSQLVARLNYDEIILTGGQKIYSSFSESHLIDEIYLTIEPVVFGSGKSLFEEGAPDLDMDLISEKKLNEKGTMLLQYKVKK